MTEESKSLEDIQSQLNGLLADLKAASDAAERRWKVTGWVFVILCAVVAIYLGMLYRRLSDPKTGLSPEGLVADAALQVRARLPGLADEFIKRAKSEAPTLVAEAKKQLPRLRQRAADSLKLRAPAYVDMLRDTMKQYIPQATNMVMARLGEAIAPMGKMTEAIDHAVMGVIQAHKENIKTLSDPDLTAKLEEAFEEAMLPALWEMSPKATAKSFDDAVMVIIEQHKENMKVLTSKDLQEKLQASFEEAAGPVLDEFAGPVGNAIASVKKSLQELVLQKNMKELSEKQLLELRYIQLWKTYWNVTMGKEKE